MAFVKIVIDESKCRFSQYDPLGCKKCLQICPQAVFASRPQAPRDFSLPPAQRFEPDRWKVTTPWDDQCDGCGACIQICPYQAISISLNGLPVV